MPKPLVSLLFLVSLGCFCAGCGKEAVSAKSNGPQAFPVTVITAQARPAPLYTDYLASLKSRDSAGLQTQVEGDVTKIYVHSGQQVAAGEPVLLIDPRKQQATVSNSEAAHKSKQAQVEQNRIDLERKKQLFAAGVIAKADLDLAQSTYNASVADADALEAAIHEQRVQLRYYTVNAPTTGTIGDIPVRVGDHVTNQTMLTTIDRGGELEAYIYVPSEKSGDVRMGLPVQLLDEDGRPAVSTRISFISPRVDTDSQTLLIKAQVPNAHHKFRNAQQVDSRVVWSEQNRPLIPVTAVSRFSGKVFAFVVEGEGDHAIARQRSIDVGDVVGNDYVVLQGIQPGDKVITSGLQILADGMPVVAK